MKKKIPKLGSKERLAALVSLLLLIIFLCIPYFNKIFIGIFGYAVYAYVAALAAMLLCVFKGYKISLPKKKMALYIGVFASFILTLHVGLAKELAVSGWGGYIFGTFSSATVGGTLASAVSSILVITAGYLISLLLLLFVTSALLFVAVFPLLVKKEGGSQSKSKKKLFERLATSQKQPSSKLQVMNLEKQEEEAAPLTVEEFEKPAPDARKLLFGDTPRPVKTVPTKTYTIDELKLKKEEKKENPYEILPNIDAPLIKPQDQWYTNNFIQTKKTSKAKEMLLGTTLEEDYRNRYGASEAPRQNKEKPFAINPYSPEKGSSAALGEEKIIFDSEEPATETPRPNYTPQTAPIVPRRTSEESAPISYGQAEYKTGYEKAVERRSGSLADTRRILFEKPQKKEEPSPLAKEEIAPRSEPKVEAKPEPRPFIYPHAGLLKNHAVEGYDAALTEEQYNKHKEILERTLEDFGISAEVFNAIKGPTVTRYELRLAQGSGNSVNKVLNLQKDLRMVLEADGEINILAPIRGKNAIGIEIPNKKRGIVSLRETILTQEFQSGKKGIKLALGKTLEGKPYIGDLEEMPHLLVAGATGTGKSVCINAIITSILFQHSPEEVKLLLIDPKKVELINYLGLPHLLVKEPLVDIPEIVTALKWIREETSQRFNKFRDMRVVNINAYNSYARQNGLEIIPKIVIVIDEASELMTKAKKEVEETLSSLARIGRAAGVHLIFATQSPTKDVITSEIQNNLNTKIAFAVSDYVHSQVIFKSNGAEKLLGKGDMFLKGSGGDLTRIQCSYVSPEEIQDIVSFILENNEVYFDEKIHDAIYRKEEAAPLFETGAEARAARSDDSFMESVREALKIGLTTKRISTSMLQRKMEKGYNGAAKIIDYLEDKGYIGAPDNVNKKREVLITVEEFLEMFPDEREDLLGME
ncbi:MAG: DNA translocase FtsK [Clostridia bacterium]|nr:DNA translocase FtsK [Clostridia bacterium]